LKGLLSPLAYLLPIDADRVTAFLEQSGTATIMTGALDKTNIATLAGLLRTR
jgi:hypothetical protein